MWYLIFERSWIIWGANEMQQKNFFIYSFAFTANSMEDQYYNFKTPMFEKDDLVERWDFSEICVLSA